MSRQDDSSTAPTSASHIGPIQIAVLLDPIAPRATKVPMPVLLGEWTSAGAGLWRFELSIIGAETAARARALVDASNDALRRYLAEGEPAQCLTGAFRDGFSWGANWQRRLTEGPRP